MKMNVDVQTNQNNKELLLQLLLTDCVHCTAVVSLSLETI